MMLFLGMLDCVEGLPNDYRATTARSAVDGSSSGQGSRASSTHSTPHHQALPARSAMHCYPDERIWSAPVTGVATPLTEQAVRQHTNDDFNKRCGSTSHADFDGSFEKVLTNPVTEVDGMLLCAGFSSVILQDNDQDSLFCSAKL